MAGAAHLRVLVVDDDADERARYVRFLGADRKATYSILEAENAAACRRALASEPVDCVLLDHAVPDVPMDVLVRELADTQGRIALPVVVLTAENDAEVAVAAVRAGAQDYAVKSRLTAEGLSRSVRNAVEKVTLRRELERKQDALNESRRRELEMKEELLSHVSHELRTPLTAVHQFVSILLDEVAGELNAQQKEFLSIIYKNAKQLRDMIGDLMDVARGGAGKLVVEPAVVALGPLVEDAVKSARASAHERSIELQMELAPTLPRVLADAGRVRQILGNLLTNAIKFSREQSRVVVRAEPETRDSSAPPAVRVSVIDQGCGIAPEALDRIFERMHQEPCATQSSRRGLGLGLYICRQLVASHGGRIWAESRPDEGATFAFTLPAYSLARQLRTLLALGDEPQQGSHLLAIDFAMPDTVDTDAADEAFTRLWSEVETLVHHDRDVVIPRWRDEPDEVGPPLRAVCFVVAHADPAAARSMRVRLLRSLRRCTLVRSQQIVVRIRTHPLALPCDTTLEEEAWLARLALEVRGAMELDRGARPS